MYSNRHNANGLIEHNAKYREVNTAQILGSPAGYSTHMQRKNFTICASIWQCWNCGPFVTLRMAKKMLTGTVPLYGIATNSTAAAGRGDGGSSRQTPGGGSPQTDASAIALASLIFVIGLYRSGADDHSRRQQRRLLLRCQRKVCARGRQALHPHRTDLSAKLRKQSATCALQGAHHPGRNHRRKRILWHRLPDNRLPPGKFQL